MLEPIRHKGQRASGGFAEGVIHLAREAHAVYRPRGSVVQEQAALTEAVSTASAAVALSMDGLDAEAFGILEFQLAMLEDDTFTEAAAATIASGATAFQAWKQVLDAEIESYRKSEDDYFQARSADLGDIRDRVLAALSGEAGEQIPPGAIYVARDISPSLFLAHDWDGGGGLALRQGSVTSHVSMLARARGIPALVGIGEDLLKDKAPALLDADAGILLVDPDPAARADFNRNRNNQATMRAQAEAHVGKPAITADGQDVAILVNIADPADVDRIPVAQVDGVGLMRTEFLFGGRHGLPDEATQLAAYRKVLDWSKGLPVTIRTVDAGGDKPVEGYTVTEDNPFLGLRGIRLSLANPDIFRVQIRALLRAAPHGALKVMLPMVSVPGEIDAAISLFEEEAAKLSAALVDHRMPEIGIMVEVPSVAVTPGRFARAAFFSIGSNDLTQYVMAASRDNGRLSALAQTNDPSVMALIANVAAFGVQASIETSLCGDAASDTDLTDALLSAGIRRLSVAPATLALVKAAVRRWRPGDPAQGMG